MINPEIQTPETQAGFDAMTYFRTLTEKNKLCSDNGFVATSCSGPTSFEGMLSQMMDVENFVVVDDTNEGNVLASDGGFFKHVTYTVWILARYAFNDMNDRQEKLNLCRLIFHQFLSKVLIDKYQWQEDFTYLLSDNVDTRELGAWFVNGLTGVEFHLDVQQPLDLVYDGTQWTE